MLACSSWAFNYVRQWLHGAAVGDVVLALRKDAFDAVVKRDMSFYDEFPSGKIVSRVTSDTQDFANVVTLTHGPVQPGPAGGGRRRRAVLSINLQLALLTLVIAPVVVLRGAGFRRSRARRSSRRSASRARGQRDDPGDDQRHRRRQEVPAGSGASTTSSCAINEQAYRVNLRSGLTFFSIFPILDIVAGHRHRARGLLRRPARARRHGLGRRLVSVHPEPGDLSGSR